MASRQIQLATIVTNPQSPVPLSLRAQPPTLISVGTFCTIYIVGQGGTGGYVYSGVTKPAWMTQTNTSLVINGVATNIAIFSGTPAAGNVGNNDVTITVTDSSSTPTTRTFRFVVSPFSVHLTPPGGLPGGNTAPPPTTPRGTVAQPYVLDLTQFLTGALVYPITATLATGSLAGTGLTLGSGTAFLTAASLLTAAQGSVTIVDSAATPNTVTVPFNIKVNPALSISGALPEAVVGAPYSSAFTITGGSGVYSAVPDTMPAGITVDRPTGRVISPSGATTPDPTSTPLARTLTVTDSNGAVATFGFTLPVRRAPPAIPANQIAVGDSSNPGQLTALNFFLAFFGGGTDGNCVMDGVNTFPFATLGGSTYTLTRDAFPANLTLSTGITLQLATCALFVAGKLDLSACTSANAIIGPVPGNGGNATAIGGGAGGNGAGTSNSSLGIGASGGAGATGVVGAGVTGGSGVASILPNGGDNFGGTGGTGGAGTGGAAGASGNVLTIARRYFYPFPDGYLAVANGPIGGGYGGPGGGSGGGDTTNKGGSGGGGGGGGAVMMIAAYEIATSGSTASQVISGVGGNGGNGFCSSTTANLGGGGGGDGGGGPYIHIRYAIRSGVFPVAALAISRGGNGGTGATNTLNATRNGRGGDYGNAGIVESFCVMNGAYQKSVPAPGSSGSGTAGGTGGTSSITL